MPYNFIVLPKADAEYYDALNWYALQQYNLPEKFALDVAYSINRILQNPESYQQYKKGYHQALMDTFPYFIIYTVDKKAELVAIVSIFHTSRHPRKKVHK